VLFAPSGHVIIRIICMIKAVVRGMFFGIIQFRQNYEMSSRKTEHSQYPHVPFPYIEYLCYPPRTKVMHIKLQNVGLL